MMKVIKHGALYNGPAHAVKFLRCPVALNHESNSASKTLRGVRNASRKTKNLSFADRDVPPFTTLHDYQGHITNQLIEYFLQCFPRMFNHRSRITYYASWHSALLTHLTNFYMKVSTAIRATYNHNF